MSDTFTSSLAILIGIDAYAHGIPQLTTAVNDAARLAELLRAAHGYETLLITEEQINQPVTLERLRALFQEDVPARLGDDDRLLVYFAGHGVALDGDDGPRGYLVPQDARPGDSGTMLAMTDLHAWLTALPCRHMLAILDCCFAGAFRWTSTRHIGALPDVIHQERYDRFLRSPAWQVLTSAAYDQKALDVLGGNVLGRRDAQGRHSPFAQALIAALEKGEADLVPRDQGDGVITATELYLYLREQVEVQAEAQVGHQQTPGLWPLKKHRKGEFIFLAPGHVLNLPPAPELTGEANPYRGLKSYDQRHTQLFFGREDEIRELAALVDRQPFVAVLGASGTGKSSLVKAGLLPRLQVESGTLQVAGGEGAAPCHVLASIRPTDQPLQALAALLRAELDADPSGFRNPKGLAQDDHVLAQFVASWAQVHPGQRLVLTIDQFEELATLCRDDGERERFLRLLAVAVQQQPDAFRLILTLRTDFEPQFTQKDSPLAKIWEPGRYVVPPMEIEDLRQVIEGPASVRVLYFEPPELVDDLIKEVVQTPGALPLLSFTLSELYVKYVRGGRDDRALSGADYQALGGVVGSLRNRATEEYDALPDDAHRLTMQRVMLRMVAVEGGELARRRVTLNELDYPTDEENARVQMVLDRLVEARLLVRGTADPSPGSGQTSDGAMDEAYVEPAHDALVLAWDKLLRWKKEAEEYLPLQRRLAQAASEWSKARLEDKPGLLWDDDPRLPQVEEMVRPAVSGRKGPRQVFLRARQLLRLDPDVPADTLWLNRMEVWFAAASLRKRAVTLRRVIAATISIFTVIAILLVFGVNQSNQASFAQQEADASDRARQTEEVLRAAAEAAQMETERLKRYVLASDLAAKAKREIEKAVPDPSLALLLAQEAITVTWQEDGYVHPDALRGIVDVVAKAPPLRMNLPGESQHNPVTSVAYSPDGKLIVATSADGTAAVWDATTGRKRLDLSGHEAEVRDAAFSPNGALIVTASSDRTARIWDVATGKELLVLSGHTGAANSAKFSPNGRWVMTASTDGAIKIWDSATGIELRSLSGTHGSINAATFSSDGQSIVTAGNDTVRVWDASTGELRCALRPAWWDQGGPYRSAVFAPDGRSIVTASAIGTAVVWDTTGCGPRITLRGHAGPINSVAYGNNGVSLVTASDDHTAKVWGADGELRLTLSGHTGPVNCAAFSPGDASIVTGGDDGIVKVWDTSTNPGRLILSSSGTSAVLGVDFSPDGTRVATANLDGTVTLWDAATGRKLRSFVHPGGVYRIAWKPDGDAIITAGRDYTVVVWDVDTGEPSQPPLRHGHEVLSAVFTRDGTAIVTASRDRTAKIWDAETGQLHRTLTGHTDAVTFADFSPDGRLIVTASDDKTARLWDAATGAPLSELSGHLGPVLYAAFSPECSTPAPDTTGCKPTIVTASYDMSAKVWDMATVSESLPELMTLHGHAGSVTSATYSPDGQSILTASLDRSAVVWDAATGAERFTLRGHTGSLYEAAFSPDGASIVTASHDGTARVWPATSQGWMQLAARAVQRHPPVLTTEERRLYGLE